MRQGVERMKTISRRKFFGDTGKALAGAAVFAGAGSRGTSGGIFPNSRSSQNTGTPKIRGRETKAASAPPVSLTAVRFELGLASYTCREFDLETAIATAKRVGLGRICLKDMHLPLTSSKEDIEAVIRIVRGSGLVPYGCGVVYMKSPEEVERAFACAEAAGMELIVGVPEHALLPLAERKVRETGIKLAIHNHGPGDRVYPTPQSAHDLIEGMDPGVGLCLDVGHAMRSGIDPSAAALECADRLHDVHLKDVSAATREGSTVEVGRGVIDIPKFLRTLVEIGYEGTAAFEHEKDGKDPLPGLAESVGYTRGVLRTLGS
jgi:inosose dehydratase